MIRITSGGITHWSCSSYHALSVLGLTGTGALRTSFVRGVVRIERGGRIGHATPIPEEPR